MVPEKYFSKYVNPYPANRVKSLSIMLTLVVLIYTFEIKSNATDIYKIRCSIYAKMIKKIQCQFFTNINIFLHLKLAIVLANPALNTLK